MYTIHVINLDRDTEKMDKFAQQFPDNNSHPKLKYTRFAACDATTTTTTTVSENDIQTDPLCQSWLCTPGVIGCAKSHMTLWKEFSTTVENIRIIMEDDARFDPESFCDAMDTVCDLLHQNKPVIVSFICIGPFCRTGSKMVRKGKTGVEYTLTQSVFPLATTAYAINKSAAWYLLQKMHNTVYYHIDFEIAQQLATSFLSAKTLSSLTHYIITTPDVVTTSTTHPSNNNDVEKSSIASNHSRSMFFGSNPRTMWQLNVPACRYASLYTTILCTLLVLLVFSGLVSPRGSWWCRWGVWFICGIIVIELVIFLTS